MTRRQSNHVCGVHVVCACGHRATVSTNHGTIDQCAWNMESVHERTGFHVDHHEHARSFRSYCVCFVHCFKMLLMNCLTRGSVRVLNDLLVFTMLLMRLNRVDFSSVMIELMISRSTGESILASNSSRVRSIDTPCFSRFFASRHIYVSCSFCSLPALSTFLL